MLYSFVLFSEALQWIEVKITVMLFILFLPLVVSSQVGYFYLSLSPNWMQKILAGISDILQTYFLGKLNILWKFGDPSSVENNGLAYTPAYKVVYPFAFFQNRLTVSQKVLAFWESKNYVSCSVKAHSYFGHLFKKLSNRKTLLCVLLKIKERVSWSEVNIYIYLRQITLWRKVEK